MIYIPPNGFTGAGQQTQAASLVQVGMPRGAGGARRRRKTKRAAPKRASAKRAAPKRASAKRGGKLVKGSAAAKRRMAALRRMRKR